MHQFPTARPFSGAPTRQRLVPAKQFSRLVKEREVTEPEQRGWPQGKFTGASGAPIMSAISSFPCSARLSGIHRPLSGCHSPLGLGVRGGVGGGFRLSNAGRQPSWAG